MHILSANEYAKGGYVPYDQFARVHEGEYVIPAQGAPVLSGGRDIVLNVVYNIESILGIDDFEAVFNEHDQKLLNKLQSLI